MWVEFRINIKRNFKALFSKVDRDWAKRNVNFVNLSIERKVYGKYFQNFEILEMLKFDKRTLESFNESRALEMLKTD